MKNSCKIMLFVWLALSATACIKEGYDAEGCPGDFIFTPVYPDGGTADAESATTVITMPDGTKKTVNIGKDNSIDLPEGDYTITTTEGKTDNVGVDKNKATVEKNPDGTPKDPGNFSAGYVGFTVGAGAGGSDGNSYTVKVVPQTRQLNIVVKFTGNNVSLVKSVGGEISGIAFSRDLNYGFLPIDGQPRHPAYESGSVPYGFNKTSGKDFLSETRRLLGIDGDAQQHVKLDILFDGDIARQFDLNVAAAMDGFHITEVEKTWTIEITINLGADFTATIEDWKAGPDIWMDAEHSNIPQPE